MSPIDSNATHARSEAVRKYFTRTPSRPSYIVAILLTLVAGVCVLPAIGSALSMQEGQNELNSCLSCVSIMSVLLGVTFGSFAALSFTRTRNKYQREYHHAEPKPSDAQIDAWHAADVERLKRYALGRLDLVWDQVATDNPKGPLVVVGSGPSPQVRTGLDRRVRFSSHEILIIYLTTYHLAAFKCVVDLHDGAIRTETTQEYHYNDVVSVSTQTDNSPLSWYLEGQLRQTPTHQRFAVSVASGEQISVAVGFAGPTDLDPNVTFAETGAEAAIRSIRARLREKKGGSVDSADRGTLL